MKKELKELRIKNGFTQKEIAEFLSMPYRTYQNYEEGITNIPDWAYLLIKFKLDSLNKYDKNKGIYKLNQIKFICKPIFRTFKITRVYLYDEYTLKKATELSPIKLLIKSNLNDYDIEYLKLGLESELKKTVEILDIRSLDKRSEFVQYILKKGICIYRSY